MYIYMNTLQRKHKLSLDYYSRPAIKLVNHMHFCYIVLTKIMLMQ